MYKIGQKVVCIDAKNLNESTVKVRGQSVIEDEIYTIRGYTSVGGLKFVGLFGGEHYDGEEAGFLKRRFVPLLEYLNHEKAVEQLLKELELLEPIK